MAQKLIILVADDDPDDVMLLRRAFKRNNIDLPVHESPDGEDAMHYLQGVGPYADRDRYPFPRILITDLKMPKKNGMELLRWLQNHPSCNVIPKVVLSNSRMEQDVKEAYQLGTNGFFLKPPTFDQLCEVVKLAHHYWSAAEIPVLPKNC